MKLDKKILYQFFFSGRSEKQDIRPSLRMAEAFSNFPLKPLNEIQRDLAGSKISTSSTKSVFSCLSEQQDGRTGLWLPRHFRLLLWNLWTELKKLDRKQDLPLRRFYLTGGSVKKNCRHGRFLKKVEHCTQVQVRWLYLPNEKCDTP